MKRLVTVRWKILFHSNTVKIAVGLWNNFVHLSSEKYSPIASQLFTTVYLTVFIY
jgi:hypothetical protein